uniref:Ant_C domain-containing protein n=1 Tax=Angiostrongylus cantonensis TaxID=6313 RepID=A0A0K0DER1_ANGCA
MPKHQIPLGEVRGHKVYPRSTVYTLQSANNWIKMARSVKEGEKPYKVVKARPKLNVPSEQREQRYLDVFGYWQTEPYRPPKVTNGRIPCNEFGNVYMYQPSMCPIGAVHLRLPGLPSIARRLGGLQCVPAVVGWDFNSCANFPM